MTSKEALQKIKEHHFGRYPENKAYLEMCYDIVEQELDVLEILKPKLSVEEGSTWEYLEVKHPFFDSQDEIDKVKECLEND